MSCIDDLALVGLRDDCGESLITTTTGYYVDDLPGLSLNVVASGHGAESESAQAEIQKHINLSKNIVADKVRQHLKSRYTLDSSVEHRTTGLYETQTAQAAQGYWVGQNIRVKSNPDAELFVSSLNLTVNTTGTVTVKAFDLFSGEELQSQDVEVTTAGIPVAASLNWSFRPKGGDLDIFIAYDATSVPSYVTRVASGWCYTCKGGVYNTRYAQVYAKKSVTGSNPTRGTVTGANGTAGLSLRWGINCSADRLLCSLGDALALPMWHYVGFSISNMMRYSKRLSPDVINYNADYEELSAQHFNEYEKAMEVMLRNVRVPKTDCYKCGAATQIAIKV
jgi:hypothetical protein